MTLYDAAFFSENVRVARSAAEIMLPPILGEFGVRSLIDVGCGGGGWLSVAKERGCTVFGVDGHAPKPPALSDGEFLSAPLDHGYDCAGYQMALCLEVAEHLPESAAQELVAGLCQARYVLWSAAIPNQCGNGHIHCQWPSYWVPLFAEHGFVGTDAIRLRHWDDDRIAGFYRNNVILFGRELPYPIGVGDLRHPDNSGDDAPTQLV